MPKPGVLKEHKAEILALREQGLPIYKIAEKFGVAPFSIQELIRRHRESEEARARAQANAER